MNVAKLTGLQFKAYADGMTREVVSGGRCVSPIKP